MTKTARKAPHAVTAVLFAGIVGLTTGWAVTARAQDAAAPSEALLNMPMGDTQLPQPAAIPTTENIVIEMPKDDTAAQNASGAVDPCPAPEMAAGASPDDLARVQEDIDRFTLCVERAQLLERYNDSVLKNDEAADKALGLGGAGGMPGMPGAQNNGLDPLPAGALAGADVSPLPTGAAGSQGGDTAAEPEAPKEWTISQIYGATNDMQAKIISPEGDEVKVRRGSKLPNGAGSVVLLSASEVVIKTPAGTKTLEWARNN